MLRAAKNLFGMQRVWRRRAHALRCVASVSRAEGFQKSALILMPRVEWLIP